MIPGGDGERGGERGKKSGQRGRGFGRKGPSHRGGRGNWRGGSNRSMEEPRLNQSERSGPVPMI
jgi:hypothetical protein